MYDETEHLEPSSLADLKRFSASELEIWRRRSWKASLVCYAVAIALVAAIFASMLSIVPSFDLSLGWSLIMAVVALCFLGFSVYSANESKSLHFATVEDIQSLLSRLDKTPDEPAFNELRQHIKDIKSMGRLLTRIEIKLIEEACDAAYFDLDERDKAANAWQAIERNLT